MANDYFNHSSTLTKHTLARAAQVNSVFESIAAGLDKLPGADPLNQGRVTYVSDTGAADAYVVSLSKAPSSYTAGLSIVMKAANTNTGASTIDVNSLGVKNIKRYDGTDLVANDILASALIHLVYDGTAFRIVGANGAESALAKEWATKTGGTVDGSENSAKSWAQETGANAPTSGSAKEWATETSTVDGGLKGARGYAQDASSSASAAATSETNAATSETNAQGHYNTFRGVFYGTDSSDPATDPNGDPPGAGDWYFNTTTNTSRQYDGSVWGDIGAATLSTFVFTAAGGETSLSGNDDNGDTLAYTVGFIQVHKNGAMLTPDDDYTATNGTSITGLSALTAGDVVVIDSFSRFNLSNAVEVATPSDDDIPVYGAGTWSGKQPSEVRTLLSVLPSIDEDDMASDSDTEVPTQQSVVRYTERGELVVDGVRYATIQAAVDAVTTATVDSPTSSGSVARQRIFLPGKEYEQTVDITSAFDGGSIMGMGVGSHLWSEDADHTLHIQNPAQNVNLYNFWVDQCATSGSHDAVHIESGGEVRLDNMDVDFAPRHAIYVNASGCKINNTEVSGGGKTSGMKLDTGAVNAVVTNMRFNDITHGASADAVDLTASKCLLCNIAITSVNNRGMVISGDENVVQNIHIRGTTGDALQISGDNNHVTGFIDGDVTLTATSNNNLIDAKISGTFTDNGTGNTRRAQ